MFLSKLSSKWRRVVTAIVVLCLFAVALFFPRERGQHIPLGTIESSTSFHGVEASVSANDHEVDVLSDTSDQVQVDPPVIVVDVKGAVQFPGVYTMQEGDRLIDAITAAGGYTPEADSRMLNHALRLIDEAVIYVPIHGEEIVPVSEPHPTASKEDDRININTASEQQLQSLPGIGPSKAAAIIENRAEQGPFQKPEDLMRVTGIGQKTFERLESSIIVK